MASVAEDRAMLALDKQLKLNEVGKQHISTPSPTWIVLLRLHFKHTNKVPPAFAGPLSRDLQQLQ